MVALVSLVFVTILLGQAEQATTLPADAAERAAAAITSLLGGDYPALEARFTPELREQRAQVGAMWGRLLLQAGPHKACDPDPRVVDSGQRRMVITRCRFERATADIQFAFDTSGRIAGFRVHPPVFAAASLPPYAKPAVYREDEVIVGTDWPLPGTLTLPSGDGPFPAVLLVHGSGPNDRDETVGAAKPFRDIALGLASRGIAVLRYEKRTRVHAAKLEGRTTFTTREEVVEDALAAAKLLRSDRRIDPTRVFVLGHSLGGLLAPRIASADPAVAGLIVLAGPARPLDQILIDQVKHLASVDGSISAAEQQAIDQVTANASAIRALTPADAAAGRKVAGALASYWLDLRDYDPAAAAADLKISMMVLQGERDFQVTMADFARWQARLSHRRDVVLKSYPSLNHLFVSGSGPATPAEYQTPGHVAEEVIGDIATWILRGPGRSPAR